MLWSVDKDTIIDALLLVITLLISIGLVLGIVYTDIKIREHFSPHLIEAIREMSFKEALFSKNLDLWLYYKHRTLFWTFNISIGLLIGIVVYLKVMEY